MSNGSEVFNTFFDKLGLLNKFKIVNLLFKSIQVGYNISMTTKTVYHSRVLYKMLGVAWVFNNLVNRSTRAPEHEKDR